MDSIPTKWAGSVLFEWQSAGQNRWAIAKNFLSLGPGIAWKSPRALGSRCSRGIVRRRDSRTPNRIGPAGPVPNGAELIMRHTKRIKKSGMRNPQVLGEAYDYPKKVSFSRGMRVELDTSILLFLSGTASVDEHGQSVHQGDFAAQARRVFSNIEGLLQSEGGDWHDIVRTTCFLTDFRHYDLFNAVRNSFYAERGLDPFPASTCVQAQLCRPELLVEIDAIAILPKDRTSA